VEEIMFCDKCGTALQADQGFCSRCGKEVAGLIVGYPQRNRVREHVRLLGIFWLALSALDGLLGVASYIVANTVFNLGIHPNRPPFLHPFLSFIGILVIVKAFAGFATGWGLLQREPWARTVAVVLAFPSLFFNVPFGTALGIYTLWVLLPAESDVEYEKEARSVSAT
jgi:predicted nucleic acid-binding Zn ribbon protein